LTLNRLGRHPLGNLLIMSLAAAFGDLGRASEWLGERLGTAGVVLPATSEPVSLVADAGGELIRGESAIAAAHAEIRRLQFSTERPTVPGAVLEAIEHANLVLLAPGSLFTSVLAASALPDVARALARTSATSTLLSTIRAHSCTSKPSSSRANTLRRCLARSGANGLVCTTHCSCVQRCRSCSPTCRNAERAGG
jgi:uncharacterized cofD-like protein